MGGTLTPEATPGGGLTMTVTLRIAPDDDGVVVENLLDMSRLPAGALALSGRSLPSRTSSPPPSATCRRPSSAVTTKILDVTPDVVADPALALPGAGGRLGRNAGARRDRRP